MSPWLFFAALIASQVEGLPADSGLPDVRTDCEPAKRLGGSDQERGALCALYRGEFASARTLIEAALQDTPNSLIGLYVMGRVQHQGEGNLPKALYYLEAARERAKGRPKGPLRPDDQKGLVLLSVLESTIDVLGEMESLDEQLAMIDRMEEEFEVEGDAMRIWSLMKLGRYKEARAAVRAGLESDNAWNQVIAKTGLCAIESELQRRFEAYEACTAAAQAYQKERTRGAVELSNAGMAAEEVRRLDEAERYYLQATRRPPRASVNPWGRLLNLYTSAGRWAEAVDVLPRMDRYRQSRPESYLDQQDESEAALLRAALALVLGYPDLASEAAYRIVSRPDRQGLTSAAKEQVDAGAAMFARAALLTQARALELEAELSGWLQGVKLRYEALQLRRSAWYLGRRSRTVLAKPERLRATLRPELPGSLEMPSWLDFDAIELVGPGVAQRALEEARQMEVLEGVEARFLAAETEIAWLQSDMQGASEVGQKAMKQPGFTLEVARAAALVSDAARRLNDAALARRAFSFAWARDPGVFLRRAIPIPVRISSTQDRVAQRASDRLKGSSALALEPWGLLLEISDKGATLRDDTAGLLATVSVEELPPEDADQALAKLVVAKLFQSPIKNMSQVGVGSLFGIVGGGRSIPESTLRSMLRGIKRNPEDGL